MLSGFTRQREIDGTKMKLSKGVIFIFLALIFKVAVAGNSTKVYMLELEFEEMVDNDVTGLLKDHTQIDVNRDVIVTDITRTTNCALFDRKKICSCTTGYTWSEDICRKYACCKNKNCEINVNDSAFCLSENRVSINGSTTLTNDSYNILVNNDPSMEERKKMEQAVITLLKEAFSTLKYFDSLIINGYGRGSVIVYYTVQILGSVTPSQLVNIIKPLNASKLTTTGLVTIVGPQKQPIDIGSNANISCTPSINLGEVQWYLTNDQNKTTPITEGKEASLTKEVLIDILQLKNISGSWKGTFTCVYTSGSIKHTASKTLDIALLPEEIQAMSTPQFPDCTTKKEVDVVIECIIPDDKENYTVTWTSGLKKVSPEIKRNGISYKAEMTIKCQKEEIVVTCTFTNNRATNNTNREMNVRIPIIDPDSEFCEAVDGWPRAKSNHKAIKSCINAVGLTTRECNGKVWGNEISSCVNEDLDDIQKRVQELNKGIGLMRDNAVVLFKDMQTSSTSKTFNSYANIYVSVTLYEDMNDISVRQKNQWKDAVLPDFVKSASNVLNDTDSWKSPENSRTDLSVKYLQTMEKMAKNINMSSTEYKAENVELQFCKGDCKSFNASVETDSGVIAIGFRNLYEIIPNSTNASTINASTETTILSVIPANNTNVTRVVLNFIYSQNRLPNHDMYCVFWDETQNEWSQEGCVWGGVSNPEECICNHNSAFTIMMAKDEITLPYMEELTYAGLGISIVSLVLCLIIEILIWDTVVKSDISNFRHVAIFNICLCLLFAHIGFLASAEPKKIGSGNWCSIITLVKHFFFLAVFFWMLCLSFLILHQIIFVFDHLRKKVFWELSITLGYVCPILCVAVTFITFGNGEAGQYYSTKTCWLIYEGVLKGSIYAFILPVGTIVFINLFTLVVVIMKIVTPTMSEAKARDEKDVAKSMIKTIVFLSPVLGITWILGFFVMHLDLTQRPWAQIVNYTFTILNSLQGFFILLTNCVGEKKVRDALRKRFRGSKQSAHSKSESSTKETYMVKNK